MLVTRSRLAHDLDKLGLGTGEVTMVHCRMSALGHVVGGAKSIVRALLDALGPEGTLVAYTGWQDAPPDDLDALSPRSSGGDCYRELRRIQLSTHWCENRLGGSSFSWLRGGPARAMGHLGE
jgi:aminoglycoside N3'-acetyltransferase